MEHHREFEISLVPGGYVVWEHVRASWRIGPFAIIHARRWSSGASSLFYEQGGKTITWDEWQPGRGPVRSKLFDSREEAAAMVNYFFGTKHPPILNRLTPWKLKRANSNVN